MLGRACRRIAVGVAFTCVHPEADWASEIAVRNLASGEERVVVPQDVPEEHPEWSPDGGSLVFNGSDLAHSSTALVSPTTTSPGPQPRRHAKTLVAGRAR
jgi:hypothetical protein